MSIATLPATRPAGSTRPGGHARAGTSSRRSTTHESPTHESPTHESPGAPTAFGAGAAIGPLRATGAPAPLRRLPLPVLEPSAAIPLVQLEPAVPPEQQLLDLGPGFGTGSRAVATAERTSVGGEEARAGDQAALAWATRFVLAAVEVAAGSRPTAQLVRWTSPEVQHLLERRAALATRMRQRRSSAQATTARRRVRVRAVRCCRIRPGVCELSAVVQEHDRTRAVALRIEQFEGRWRATAFELG